MAASAEEVSANRLMLRPAELSDLPSLIAMFADDQVGGHGDTVDPVAMPDYRAAFEWIVTSPNDAIHVAELDGVVVGTFQTTRIVGLAGRGSASVKVSSVQVRAGMRGRGIGTAMIRFAIEEARRAGAGSLQLMSNAKRKDALRFYVQLGFQQSHAGFKISIADQ